jgi:hypothetical protein
LKEEEAANPLKPRKEKWEIVWMELGEREIKLTEIKSFSTDTPTKCPV